MWKAQQAESQAQIELLAIEIAATVPQLAGYHEQLEHLRLTDEGLPLRPRPWSFKTEAHEIPDAVKVTASGSMEYDAHFGNDPSPFRKGEATAARPTRASKVDPDNEVRELQVDAPTRIFPPVSAAQPASVYHLLFQLYSLSTVSVLPAPFKEWIRERITWLEDISNPEDLARLRDMVAKSPGDGFPVASEG
jgi:hypothetical protein